MATVYCEKLSDIGMRFVGYADEIVRLRHKGWFTAENGLDGETLRGVVVQLPGRKGHAVLLAGYQDSASGGYSVDLSSVTYHKATDSYFTDSQDVRDVARAADGMAERAAEMAQAYGIAWSLGQRYADLDTEAAELRATTLTLLREYRMARKVVPATMFENLCATIRRNVESNYRRILDARQERDAIVSEGYFRGDLRFAFNDGAGKDVL